MTLTPPRNGDEAAQCRAQRLLGKNPWHASNADGGNVARLLDAVTPDAPEKVAPALRGVHAGCFPAPDTRAVICNAASCAGVRSAEPPAHESPPSPRVPRVRRPGSSNITASCVRAGVCAVTLAADPACAPGRAARAPACRHPSRPPLTGAPQKVGA